LARLEEKMAQPNKTKKTVDQTGYNSDIEPFVNNYRNLYRQLLEKNREMREELEQYEEAISNIPDNMALGETIRYIYEEIGKKKEKEDE